ncbi:MAG: peptidase [Pirellulales bacterium]|nr:peptidase [Pirellulales bacterium]
MPRRRPAASRRQFLHTAAAATLASAAGPVLLGAERKSGSGLPVIGTGEHTYEVQHGWGELPDHVVWGDTHGVAIDAAGLVYIKHRSDASEPMDSIVVFDSQGKYVRSFGKEYHGGGHGIDIRRDGNEEFLYLSDIHNRQVVKTTLTGEVVWKLSYPQEPGVYQNLQQYRPTNVAFHPDGGFYVADGYGSHYIHQYDAQANWLRTWGGEGDAPGKMRTPHGIWLDNRPGREPALVVADRANARLQYFTLDGQHLGFVHDVSFPAHFDLRGSELLVPDLHARVSIFDIDNKPVVHLGYDANWTAAVLADNFAMRRDPARWQPGRFIHPHDACWDSAGNIYVVEWVPTGRVSFLRRVG